MDSVGAEVGQKMRSAIKAKLMELNCYVDNELPDYIMVMVANKRTKTQMNDDLNLFLTNKTTQFVDWLHIVLKKLKEVTVTNPDILKKKAQKRKSEDSQTNIKVKKEKKEKKSVKKVKSIKQETTETGKLKSLTDDLPISLNKLAEQRKIVVMSNEIVSSQNSKGNDTFDIPLLSEVEVTNENLAQIEEKIKSVKSRLGLQVDSDSEDLDIVKLKAEVEELFPSKKSRISDILKSRMIEIEKENAAEESNESQPMTEEIHEESAVTSHERKRITFSNDDIEDSPTKKRSIRDRLGKRSLVVSENSPSNLNTKRTRISLSEFRKEEEALFGKHTSSERKDPEKEKSWKNRGNENRKGSGRDRRGGEKESILSRLGVMSKVSVPLRESPEPEDEFKGREVPSMVKIKPRVIPPNTTQANKNLLLKAVADAQRSIAQTPTVGNNSKPDALYTKKYKEKSSEENSSSRKLPEKEKNKIKNLIAQMSSRERSWDDEDRYSPKPVKKSHSDTPKYVPSSRTCDNEKSLNGEVKQQFIVTLDGIETAKYNREKKSRAPIESRLGKRRSPSPIVFDKVASSVKSKSNIPDRLPVVHPPLAIKNKERCKYWPNCRQGDKCEFVHPSSSCDMFPHCKFGEKCLYLHPMCKFGSSCTRRDCPYSHNGAQKTVASRIAPSAVPVKVLPQSLQTCKYFPKCSNINCTFYHPKPCKFGKYCKNQGECNFSHSFVAGSNLTWRSK